MNLLILLVALNPFFDGGFTSLGQSATAVFENPSGLGYDPRIENMTAIHHDSVINGICLKGIGLGIIKRDSCWTAEAGLGYKLPGAFAVGYAYRFTVKGAPSIKTHYLGLGCRPSSEMSFGFTTTLARTKYLHGGLSIKPAGDIFTLSADFDYEGRSEQFLYYLGGMIQFGRYLNVNFRMDGDQNWTAGMGFGYSVFRIAAVYGRDRKFGIGLIVGEEQSPPAIETE
jgi:hypothetical protein